MVLAAILLAFTPVFLFQSIQPMSDVPVTAVWMLCFAWIQAGGRYDTVAGLACAMAVLIRPNLAPLAIDGVEPSIRNLVEGKYRLFKVITMVTDPTSMNETTARFLKFTDTAAARAMLERTGHTEAAVDFARLLKRRPAGVICEIMNDDGTMARRPQLEVFCQRHQLVMTSVAQLVAYRRQHAAFTPHTDTALVYGN